MVGVGNSVSDSVTRYAVVCFSRIKSNVQENAVRRGVITFETLRKAEKVFRQKEKKWGYVVLLHNEKSSGIVLLKEAGEKEVVDEWTELRKNANKNVDPFSGTSIEKEKSSGRSWTTE
ncbi:MAG: hypothetical protein WC906_03930 [Parcubacteria group bacterium]|jgi:hypothetical protein